MSMNLHAKTRYGTIDLYQTPTWLSYAATIDHKGVVLGSVKGIKAKRALRIYCQWVGSLSRNMEEKAVEELLSHIEYIKSRLKEPGLEVYIM